MVVNVDIMFRIVHIPLRFIAAVILMDVAASDVSVGIIGVVVCHCNQSITTYCRGGTARCWLCCNKSPFLRAVSPFLVCFGRDRRENRYLVREGDSRLSRPYGV